jgi:Co/Zn/Cd efflux system component
MACSCHTSCSTESAATPPPLDPRWRRALWVALWVNAIMFVVELVAGWQAGSVSLLADAVDFAGDAANYGLSLAVLSMAMVWRSRAALVKGATMLAYGLFVMAKAAWMWQAGGVPHAVTMGGIGLLALLANTGVALMLYRWRQGDANMRSVWLCSRNDALSNLAVITAAAGVFGTGSAWPDLVVAAIMALLAISAGWSVVRQARDELTSPSQGKRGPAMQHPLALRVPPLLLLVLAGLLMYTIKGLWPAATLAIPTQLGWPLALIGLVLVAMAWHAFRRSNTTVDPRRPAATTSLVTNGVYRLSRNPMYLGFALVLAAWALSLQHPGALAVVVLYVIWIDRLQIRPEEMVLTQRLGPDYAAYCAGVRRWI